MIACRNRRGHEYYLHEGKTKTGKVSCFFSRKTDGVLAAAMPPGFEAYETGNGTVVLHKTIPCLVTSEEVTTVWTALKENAKARSAYVDARGDAITVFMPDIDVEEGAEEILDRNPMPILNRKRLMTILERSQTFTPLMRFVMLDEKTREFSAERWCFSGVRTQYTGNRLLSGHGLHYKQMEVTICPGERPISSIYGWISSGSPAKTE